MEDIYSASFFTYIQCSKCHSIIRRISKDEETAIKRKIKEQTINFCKDCNKETVCILHYRRQANLKDVNIVGVDNKKFAFLYFYSDLCSMCDRINMIITDVGETFDIEAIAINVNNRNDLVKKFGIEYTPTVLLVIDNKVVDKLSMLEINYKNILKMIGGYNIL